MHRRKAFIIALALLSVLLGCNLPIEQPGGLSLEDEAATIVALTMQAQPPKEMPTPLASPTAISILTSSAPAMLSVSDNTNCRSGPGTKYEIIVMLTTGNSYQVVARAAAGDYWIINAPSGGGTCWVAAEFAAVTGDTTALPEVTPAAQETSAGAPAKPGSLYYQYSCSFNGVGSDVTTTLTWSDAANNESGYRVYRNNTVIVELPANSTQYVDQTSIALGGMLEYSVEAFNAAGASPRRTISFSCQ